MKATNMAAHFEQQESHYVPPVPPVDEQPQQQGGVSSTLSSLKSTSTQRQPIAARADSPPTFHTAQRSYAKQEGGYAAHPQPYQQRAFLSKQRLAAASGNAASEANRAREEYLEGEAARVAEAAHIEKDRAAADLAATKQRVAEEAKSFKEEEAKWQQVQGQFRKEEEETFKRQQEELRNLALGEQHKLQMDRQQLVFEQQSQQLVDLPRSQYPITYSKASVSERARSRSRSPRSRAAAVTPEHSRQQFGDTESLGAGDNKSSGTFAYTNATASDTTVDTELLVAASTHQLMAEERYAAAKHKLKEIRSQSKKNVKQAKKVAMANLKATKAEIQQELLMVKSQASQEIAVAKSDVSIAKVRAATSMVDRRVVQ